MAILTPPRHLDVLRKALSDADAGAAQYKTDLFGIITYAGQVRGYVLPNLNNPASGRAAPPPTRRPRRRGRRRQACCRAGPRAR